MTIMGRKAKHTLRLDAQREIGAAIAAGHPLHGTRVAWCLHCQASTTQQVTTTVISEAAIERAVRCEHCGSDIESAILHPPPPRRRI